MEIITDSQLLERIEVFLVAHDMSASRFGINVMGDGALVFQLRAGNRSLSLKNAAKVIQYMHGYRSAKQGGSSMMPGSDHNEQTASSGGRGM